MGFVFNGKIYVLSLVEDMFLQNRLVRLPNWAHTSNLLHTKPEKRIRIIHQSSRIVPNPPFIQEIGKKIRS